MPTLTPRTTACGVGHVRHSLGDGCALRPAGGALGRPFGLARFLLTL